jgi:hypothetical protein
MPRHCKLSVYEQEQGPAAFERRYKKRKEKKTQSAEMCYVSMLKGLTGTRNAQFDYQIEKTNTTQQDAF